MVRPGVMKGHRQATAQNVLLQVGKGTAHKVAEFVHGGAEVTLGIQLLVKPAVLEALFKAGDFLTALAVLQRFEYRLSAQDAGFHGSVGAFGLGAVQGAGVTAQQ